MIDGSPIARARRAHNMADDQPCDGCDQPVLLTDNQVFHATLTSVNLWHAECEPLVDDGG